MGILGNLLGTAGADKVVAATGKALDGLFTSDDERLTHAEIVDRIKQNPQKWQADINLADAKSGRFFQGGWRPGIGWVCGVSLGLFYIPQYATAAYLWVHMCLAADKLLPYPVDAAGVTQLVLSMLGMAAIRSVDKSNGVAS